MPSKSYKEYQKNLRDVRRLVTEHDRKNAANPGKRGLGHFTRGGLLLLCAAWERYNESVIEESAGFLASSLTAFGDLPNPAQKKVKDWVNSGKTSYQASDLQSASWKNVYIDYAKTKTEKLNTPKYNNLKILCEDLLGVPDIGIAWALGTKAIDDFISHRGAVAHRGTQSPYVRIGYLKTSEDMIMNYVRDTENFLSDHLKTRVTPNYRPWNRFK